MIISNDFFGLEDKVHKFHLDFIQKNISEGYRISVGKKKLVLSTVLQIVSTFESSAIGIG